MKRVIYKISQTLLKDKMSQRMAVAVSLKWHHIKKFLIGELINGWKESLLG